MKLATSCLCGSLVPGAGALGSASAPSVLLPVHGGFVTRVDPDIAELLAGQRLCVTGHGYPVFGRTGCMILLHHCVVGRPLKGEVDHINGDRLDNRRCNLRIVSHQRNMLNMRRKRPAASGFRGVARSNRLTRWRAYLRWHGRLYRDVSFREPVLAALARDDKVRRVTGFEDGLNFPYPMLRTELAGLLRTSALWPVTLWFVKRCDGSIRKLVCRAAQGVPSHRLARDAAQNLVTVTDVDNGQFRCIPLEAILCLRYQDLGWRITA